MFSNKYKMLRIVHTAQQVWIKDPTSTS